LRIFRGFSIHHTEDNIWFSGKRYHAPKFDRQKLLLSVATLGFFHMGLNEQDIYDLRMWFEEALNRSAKRVEKPKKMRMRRKVRDEIFFLLTWEKPSPSAIIKRWEDNLIIFCLSNLA
jgi:hypothetical protein